MRRVFGAEPGPTASSAPSQPPIDPDATLEGPVPSAPFESSSSTSIILQPSGYKLRVAVVSTTGNYREHNEDNFFVPGVNSVKHDAISDASGEVATSTLETNNIPLIVADGMGGQQAGEHASLMAVQI